MGLNIVLACGGTGGHVFPALAVGRELSKVYGAHLTVVGREGTLEERLARAEGLDFCPISAVPLHRAKWWKNLWLPFAAARAFRLARRALGSIQANAVLATGGYVSLPTGLAARSMGIPVFIHESNAFPGIANRLLARVARVVFAGSPACARAIGGAKVEISGNPARALDGRSRQELRKLHGLGPSDRFLVVLGGSQGARGINRILSTEVRALLARGWKILWQSGPSGLEEARASIQGLTGVRVEAFLDDVYGALGAADLALTRSGASTLAELALHGLASVLVPFPFATGNHQEANARELELAGAARVILESQWQPGQADSALETLWSQREEASTAMKGFARPDAAAQIAKRMMFEIAGKDQA